jgi:prophage DNA circulation protein
VHTFPNRDDPYVEDLGEEPRLYSGSAYVHGDNADGLASTLKAALASRGAGILVVPYFGPVTVHLQTFERTTQRDQMGYVAFELKFVRKGASSGLVSVPLLQSVAFQAADTVANVLGQLFPQTIATLGRPDSVVSAVTDTLSQGAAAIDVLRQSYAIDPAVSALVRDAIPTVVGTIATSITNDAAPGAAASAAVVSLVGLVRQTMDAMPASSATRAPSRLSSPARRICRRPSSSRPTTPPSQRAPCGSLP